MNKRVAIDYTNWRGERRIRKIQPMSLEFTSDQYHPTPQWLVKALDVDSSRIKRFAMSQIHSWVPEPEETKDRP